MSRWSIEKLQAATDEELLQEYDKARSAVSYYNAAESPQWGLETQARHMAKNYMELVGHYVRERGLEPNPGNFLC